MKTKNKIYFDAKFLPFIITAFLLLILYIPTSIFMPQNIRPLLALASAFFWLTHRPDLFGLYCTIVIGIIADTISSNPFGSNILMFVSLYALVDKFEKFFYNKSFLIYWYGFIAFSFVAILLKWLVLSCYYAQFLPLLPTFFMYLTTAFMYPIVSIINAIAQSYMRDADE